MRSVQSDQVRAHFANDWADYDQQIKSVIPFYDQAFSTLLDVIVASYPKPKRILDLGVGTGNLARRLLATFPEAHLTGIDLVEEFINMARLKLSNFGKRSTLQCMDVIDFEFKDHYDVIVTSFVFHHLEDETKRAMYSRVFGALSSGGCFFNADFVGAGAGFYSDIFDRLRIERMREAGVSEERIQREYIEHRQVEIPVAMEEQMKWLEEIGYVDRECIWKYLNLAIFGGRKP